jgi:HEAT repeat protein
VAAHHARAGDREAGTEALPGLDDLIKAREGQRQRRPRVGAKALGKIGAAAEKAVPAAIERLDDDDDEARMAAATALGKIGQARRTRSRS